MKRSPGPINCTKLQSEKKTPVRNRSISFVHNRDKTGEFDDWLSSVFREIFTFFAFSTTSDILRTRRKKLTVPSSPCCHCPSFPPPLHYYQTPKRGQDDVYTTIGWQPPSRDRLSFKRTKMQITLSFSPSLRLRTSYLLPSSMPLSSRGRDYIYVMIIV